MTLLPPGSLWRGSAPEKKAIGFFLAGLILLAFPPLVSSAEPITSWSDEVGQLVPFVGLLTGDRVSGYIRHRQEAKN